MNCCGQKRYQWQQRMSADKEPVPVHAEPVLENPVQLQYSGINTILVKGKQTGYLYIFGAGEPALTVDGRDVQEILSLHAELTIA
jgi:hypothetical protein